jgi:hypothetical protein
MSRANMPDGARHQGMGPLPATAVPMLQGSNRPYCRRICMQYCLTWDDYFLREMTDKQRTSTDDGNEQQRRKGRGP